MYYVYVPHLSGWLTIVNIGGHHGFGYQPDPMFASSYDTAELAAAAAIEALGSEPEVVIVRMEFI